LGGSWRKKEIGSLEPALGEGHLLLLDHYCLAVDHHIIDWALLFLEGGPDGVVLDELGQTAVAGEADGSQSAA
jgi:hypothetical protein